MGWGAKILVPAAAALVTVNAWVWWPNGPAALPNPASDAVLPALRAEDFQIRGLPAPAHERPVRNLFRILSQEVRAPGPALGQSRGGRPARNAALPPAALPLAAGASGAEPAPFRFVGWVTRNEHEQAFLMRGNDSFIVAEGDLIEGRYTVQKVTPEAITIIEGPTSAPRVIPFTGY